MRALVLGAAGHVGQGVVRELLTAGYGVTAVTRRRRPPSLRNLPVDVVVGDTVGLADLDRWMPGHEVVVDAAAPKPLGYFTSRLPHEDPVAAARRRARRLVRSVARHGPRLAYVSSFSTLPRPARFDDPRRRWRHATHAYFRVKGAMEEVVMEGGRRGLPIVVANPTAVYGPWETCPRRASLVQRVLTCTLPWVMRHVVNVVDVRDVAAGIRAAVEQERFGTQTPMSGHDVGLDELARRLAARAGVPAPLPVDPVMVGVAGFCIEGLWALARRPPPTAVCAVPVVEDAWPMGASEALRELGVAPRALSRTLDDAVRWALRERR